MLGVSRDDDVSCVFFNFSASASEVLPSCTVPARVGGLVIFAGGGGDGGGGSGGRCGACPIAAVDIVGDVLGEAAGAVDVERSLLIARSELRATVELWVGLSEQHFSCFSMLCTKILTPHW